MAMKHELCLKNLVGAPRYILSAIYTNLAVGYVALLAPYILYLKSLTFNKSGKSPELCKFKKFTSFKLRHLWLQIAINLGSGIHNHVNLLSF